MAIKVERFRTSDGRLFEIEAEADKHEQYLIFKAWYDQHSLLDIDGELIRVYDDEFQQWLKDNFNDLNLFFGKGDGLIPRIKELEEALEDLINTASKCDSWESFPSGPLDEAIDILNKGRRS